MLTVNRTWERRAEITPDHQMHQRPAPMAIYKLLPLTNCKQCGEATCMAFAVGLLHQNRELTECLPFSAFLLILHS
jgi:ArsR family metal-binding transcriptional regulator